MWGDAWDVTAPKAPTLERIERDYQELKQVFGLSHYEGRSLPFLQITSPAGAPRAQRHVVDSLRTLRLRLSAALAQTWDTARTAAR